MKKLNMDTLKELWATKKKQILILAGIVVVLALLLSTCGNKGGDYDDLIALLEKGEYQSAHYYIDSLQRKAIEEGKVEEEKESQLPIVYGEWTLSSNYGNEEAFETISFAEDGSCKIGSDSLKWRMTDEQDTYIGLDVTEGETKKYRVSINTGNKEIMLSLSEYQDQEGATKSIGEYRNLAFYDVIEITTENLEKYFEITEVGQFGENAFGEVESFYLNQYLSLKEEYVEKLSSSLTDLDVELDFTYGKKGCQVDLANKKYTLTDSYEVSEYDYDSSIYHFSYMSNDDETYYRAQIGSPSYYAEESCLSGYKTDMQIIRVQGSLYLLK